MNQHNNTLKEESKMSLRKLVVVMLLLLACGVNASAQKVITGTVTELFGTTKEPIIGANVVLVNSQNRYVKGVVTDMNGNYSIQVPSDAGNLRIKFSYIGKTAQTFKYNGQTHLDVTLVESSQHNINEVVVTARRTDGMGVSRIGQTSSVQSLKVDKLVEESPVGSIEEALQGQIAGLDISMGGDPGARSSIRIRGTNTLSGSSEPLIVVDGVPYDTEISNDFNFATANEEDFGALLNIAPSNIESIDVLKDASATAIYGSKGANGVLLINTKKGSMGKTRFTFSSKWTTKKEPESVPLLNGGQYISLMQDELWNAANAKGTTSATNEMNMLFNSNEINYNPDYKYYNEYNADTDWLETVKQNALVSDNNFAMSGGGDKAVYRLSLGYYDEQGTTRGTGLNRLSSQMKITYNFSDRLRVRTDFSFTNTNKDANYSSNLRSVAMKKMPNASPYWWDKKTGSYSDRYFVQESDFQGAYPNNYNPLALAELGYNKTTSREEKMTVALDYDFPFHLKFSGWVSMNLRTTKNKQFLPQEATGVLWTSTNANRSTDATSDAFSLRTEMKLLYNNTFAKKHNLVATAVMRTTQNQNSSETSVTYGNASRNLADPVVGSVVASSGSGDSETRSVAMIGQMVYTFDNRYALKATVNHEGNSAMGRSHRFGTYPAFGFAWNLDQEHFLGEKTKNWLTNAKVRFGLGWAGKAPSGASVYYGAYESLGNYVDMSAIYPVRMQLNKLKWETTREFDLGIDLRFWDKLGITFDYYDKTTSDLLLKKTKLPVTTGYNEIAWINSGEMTNKGFELRFDYDIFKNKNWTISANANISRNINKVEKLPSTWTYDNYTFGNGNYALRIVEGAPVGAFYGYRYKGVYQNTEDTYARDANGGVMYDYQGKPIVMRNGSAMTYAGDAKYEDINHDGVINENDIVYLGNANPKLTGGGGFSIKWKDLTFTTFFYGRFGQRIINAARMSLESMYGTSNQSTATLNRWRHEGDITDIPRALYGMGYNYLGSDRFVENATFIRMKTLSLSWNVPKKMLKKLHLGISRANVFATGYDLFTWTNYKGQDPEVSLPSATSLVKDNATTPVTKRYSFGVTVNF
jgi:TonB-linked SusC/RagA family outer membrane protein